MHLYGLNQLTTPNYSFYIYKYKIFIKKNIYKKICNKNFYKEEFINKNFYKKNFYKFFLYFISYSSLYLAIYCSNIIFPILYTLSAEY